MKENLNYTKFSNHKRYSNLTNHKLYTIIIDKLFGCKNCLVNYIKKLLSLGIFIILYDLYFI